MDAAVEQLQTLLELEARHEELLQRLAELDQRVTGVLAQCQAPAAANQGKPPAGEGDTHPLAVHPQPILSPLAEQPRAVELAHGQSGHGVAKNCSGAA